MRKQMARALQLSGVSIRRISQQTGISIRHVYNMREGKAVCVDKFMAVFHLLPAYWRSRIAETEGLVLDDHTGPHYTLGEAAAGVAGFNADYCEALADNRIDHRERLGLIEHARKLKALLGGLLRKERQNVG